MHNRDVSARLAAVFPKLIVLTAAAFPILYVAGTLPAWTWIFF
jgi:hypothetical protein